MDRRELMALLGFMGGGIVVGGSEAEAAEHEKKEPGQRPTPVTGPFAHFCGIHIAKKDPKFQLVVQHYCVAHTDGHEGGEQLFQCILFDSTEKNAKLIGVEYLISDKAYRALPAEEKKYWHAHTYEVLGGGLIAPGMKPEDELAFMKVVITTWGKAWHTWPDPRTAVPMGDPLLIWSLMGDGQVDEKVLAARDKEFGVETAKIREKRCKEIGLQVPRVSVPKNVDEVGRQWTDNGEDKPTKTE
jgi:hypothetical protein